MVRIGTPIGRGDRIDVPQYMYVLLLPILNKFGYFCTGGYSHHLWGDRPMAIVLVLGTIGLEDGKPITPSPRSRRFE